MLSSRDTSYKIRPRIPPDHRSRMASKCVRKGCGKTFSDPEEECVYHPGPPIFHEGQKGVGAPSSEHHRKGEKGNTGLTLRHRLEML